MPLIDTDARAIAAAIDAAFDDVALSLIRRYAAATFHMMMPLSITLLSLFLTLFTNNTSHTARRYAISAD